MPGQETVEAMEPEDHKARLSREVELEISSSGAMVTKEQSEVLEVTRLLLRVGPGLLAAGLLWSCCSTGETFLEMSSTETAMSGKTYCAQGPG